MAVAIIIVSITSHQPNPLYRLVLPMENYSLSSSSSSSSLAQSQSIKNVYRELQQLITRSTNKPSNLCITIRPTHLIYIHFRRSVPSVSTWGGNITAPKSIIDSLIIFIYYHQSAIVNRHNFPLVLLPH